MGTGMDKDRLQSAVAVLREQLAALGSDGPGHGGVMAALAEIDSCCRAGAGRTALGDAEEALRRRDGILEAVAFAAARFLGSTTWEESIQEVLESMGRAADVGRAYIYRNETDDDGLLHMSLLHEWSDPGVLGNKPSRADAPELREICYGPDGFERWVSLMEQGEAVIGRIEEFPEPERRFLSTHNIAGIAAVPISAHGHWWGFMGLDEWNHDREWYPAVIDALKTAARTLGAAIGKQLSQAATLQLATAIQQAAEAILITDHKGNMMYVNPAFEQISGYSSDEALGQNPKILKSGKHEDGFYREMWETLSAGRVWEGRIINRRKDGSLYEDETTISPVRDAAGEITNFVSVKRDVTHEVRIEEQLRRAQRMEAIGLLAGGVAHDFGNVLTPIMAYSEMALSKLEEGDPIHEYTKQIQGAAERAEVLIRQLLAFSRKKDVLLRTVDVNEVVSGFKNMLQRIIREDIELDFQLTPEPATARVDASQIEQILMNLSVNARDAMPGGGKVTIRTTVAELSADTPLEFGPMPGGRYVVLCVDDCGCGMDEETRSQIFEPFFTTKETGEGTGLGLSTVYGIVKQHGGSIEVMSEVGKGTTFKIYFPEAGPADDDRKESREAKKDLTGTETVVVVEDDQNVRSLACEILKRCGYEVLVFEDPTRALRFAKRLDEHIDLLLTDVIMLRMNGKELYMRLSAFRPDLKVLYMSGYTGNVIGKYGVLDPEVNFLKKPFSLQTLTQEVRKALDA